MLQHSVQERAPTFGKVNWAEKRNSVRRPAREAAAIVIDGARQIDCILVDVSESGACLQVSSVVGIPETFRLKIEGQGRARECHFRWALEGRIGVRFL